MSSRALCLTCLFFLFGLRSEGAAFSGDVKKDYPGEPFVIEHASSDVTVETGGSYVDREMASVRIQSDAGLKHYGLLIFPYQKATGKLIIDYVRVQKADGSVVNTPTDDAQDMASEVTRQAPFYSDLYERHLAVKGLAVGDVLEYSSHMVVDKPLAPGQFWFAFNFTHDNVALEQQLSLSVPNNLAIKYSNVGDPPVILDEAGKRTYTWTNKHLSLETEAQRKQNESLRTWENARGFSPRADVLISSFQSWDAVGRWYEKLQMEEIKGTPEIKAKAAQLTRDAKDEQSKIQAIYDFVSLQNRYIGVGLGIGRYQPHPANDVLENGYGDCKDKHTLFAALLDAAGIKAYPALVNTQQYIDPTVPSPGQFNHVITAIVTSKGLLWADTTPELAPLGDLISRLYGRPALLIRSGETANLADIPANTSNKPVVTFSLSGTIDDSGTLEAKINRIYDHGDESLLLRSGFRSVATSQWTELTQRLSYASGFAGDVSDVTVSEPEKTAEPLKLSYKYLRKDFPEWTSGRISSPLPRFGIPAVTKDDDYPPTPIWLASPRTELFHAEVTVPSDDGVEPQKQIDEVKDFAEYHASYKFVDGKLVSDRKLIVKLEEVPVQERLDYEKFYKVISDDYDKLSPITARHPAAPSPDLPPLGGLQNSQVRQLWQTMSELPRTNSAEALRLSETAQGCLQKQELPCVLSNLRSAVVADPKYTRAWLMLGFFSSYSKDHEGRELALQKAIDSAPDNPAVYRAAANIYLGFNDRPAAIQVYQQLLKVAPDDFDALENVGVGLLLEKQYAGALSVLESAHRIKPDDVGVELSLGEAYLGVGQDDAALAAYKKAIDADSSNESLNSAAYSLAEASKHLPLALEYAQKAVADEEEKSESIDLASLEKDDLSLMNTIAADWDTLGWVYFQMGDDANAENYLKAAWLLSMNREVGDHVEAISKRQKRQFSRDQSELNRIRTVRIHGLNAITGSAEYFILFSRNPKTGSPEVTDTKFISGSDNLKSAGDALASAKYEVVLPDEKPTKLVRRGILGCYKLTGCSFVLLMPDSVRSVN